VDDGILSNVLGSVPDQIAQLALALIACYFFLQDGERFARWIAPKIPLEANVRAKLALTSKEMVVQSALATLAAAFVQALIVLIGFLILDLPIAWIAFGAAFIFAWLPIVGVTPVWGIAMIVLFAQDETGKALAMLVIGMISGVADNVVRPWVLKGRSDLHPLVSLIVIFGHIHFFGILGVFTGPVFAALLIEALELWPEVSKSLGLYAGPTKSPRPLPDSSASE
jgi:predicted PurR-regulated permease PerM